MTDEFIIKAPILCPSCTDIPAANTWQMYGPWEHATSYSLDLESDGTIHIELTGPDREALVVLGKRIYAVVAPGTKTTFNHHHRHIDCTFCDQQAEECTVDKTRRCNCNG